MMMTIIMTPVTADTAQEIPVLRQAFPYFVSCDRKFTNGKIWHKGMIVFMDIKQIYLNLI